MENQTIMEVLEDAHGRVHDICFNIGNGNIEVARGELKTLDMLLHDAIQQQGSVNEALTPIVKSPMGKQEELARAAAPMAEFLTNNYHPHTKAIVTQESVEVVEGVSNVPDIFEHLSSLLRP
jgi:hypothetical protein